MTQKAALIRALLKQKSSLLMPGVYDALSAKLAARADFEVIFTTGYSLSATLLGEPDFGLLTQTEMLAAAQRICGVVEQPVIVDADTGYGNAINVIRTVKELIRAGAAGLFLEDQVWPKRCGHMKGKAVIPLEEQLKKLTAALEAREGGDLFVVARTDARQALGLKEAIRRGVAFKQAGADAVFIEAPETKEEMREIAQAVPGPLVANMIERGVTPLMSPEELSEVGFQMIVWPLAPLYASAKALKEVYGALRAQGTTQGILDRLMPFDEFHEIVGLDEKYALDARYRS
ncbi:MAG: carboxyvinyl-carboxyphosphonate phosphorylmutase [Deltaproteobacteria bacterium GWA2_57_13]|nr:MAG: carboxyvinyl-carboxyphosphonate phosphorylmutase [Deltaproteobacteria bacterium GWA2_57_13]OGQ49485.1 MAG: carboxyvinyl-carboxyphosphonate phosphorylmutase [Deltaproteobacteria bacterium RIFCSPLOWO2_02_FULL_57_26]OGQ73863.1 MAG: carboxyvinyl-carboxyphosphonate phosphorylmutase [Deltaproteobacteria bacterium RIFCSPLOWO2_12_FULL_57_22]